MSFISKASCTGAEIPEESDEQIRCAFLYLGKTQIGGNGRSSGLVNHWFLAVQFDDCWVTLQANNYFGLLVPMYSKSIYRPCGDLYPMDEVKGPPDSLNPLRLLLRPLTAGSRLSFPVIFRIMISPRLLRHVTAIHHSNNTKYDVAFNNCQTWARRAASLIDAYRT